MNLVLHPRAAPPDRLRFWVGAFRTTSAPPLRWFLDANEVAPVALRPIQSVRPETMLAPQLPPSSQSRVFAGVYELAGLIPSTVYTVTVASGASQATLRTSTLPGRVPTTLDGSFNVLLVSCFHQHEDKKGLAGIIVSQLAQSVRPHLTLLMGDQVYLDLPTLQDFPNNEAWLARKFEDDYSHNWQGPNGYAHVLDAAPSFSLPDDHEYWNNYPHVSPMIGNSWTQGGRDRWRRAALAVYEGFQRPYPFQLDEPATLDVEPLSFFVPDMRTLRDPGRGFLLTDTAHARLEQWVNRVVAERLFGIFVTGQSLYSDPASGFSGSIADYELPNYGDYGRVMKQLERLADAGRPVLCLTGDVHWGRVTVSTDVRLQRAAFYEVIASPSSLVTTVGFDTVKRVGAWFKDLFGEKDPWARHASPSAPPDFLASDALAGRFRNRKLHGQRGNHVALLRFSQHAGGLSLRITYWPIARDPKAGEPGECGPFFLKNH